LGIIQPKLLPKKFTVTYYVRPLIKLCLGLRLLAGASNLDLSFGYNVPPTVVHTYAWQALDAIDTCNNAYLDNIKSPIHVTAEELSRLELGFAELNDFIESKVRIRLNSQHYDTSSNVNCDKLSINGNSICVHRDTNIFRQKFLYYQ
jgi:hypothetical protein